MTVLSTLLALESELAAAGVPSLSPYWRAELERFYSHASARLLVEMVGRGGDKSRTSVIMAISEVVAGNFVIPPGERHYFTHVSENREEAAKTLGVLQQYLRILGIGFRPVGDTLELTDSPRGFKVLACRVGAVSGWRCIGWTADEAAKWSDDGSDPSEEVIASIRAMTITHADARGRMFSSPVASLGFFYERWAAGDNDNQVTGHAPSWVANPSITEERTHELEPHEPTRQREYGAVASSGSSDALDPADIAAMVRPLNGAQQVAAPVVITDSSSGRGDGWSFALARYVRDGGRRVLHVDQLGAFEGHFGKSIGFEDVVASIAALARTGGAQRIFGDQFQGYALVSGFAAHGLAYEERPWTQPTKIEALSTLRRLLRERSIVIEPSTEASALARELLTLREVLLPSKVFTVQARRTGKGHADRASMLLMLARAVAEGDLIGGTVGAGSSSATAGARFMAIPTRFGGGGSADDQAWQQACKTGRAPPTSGATPGLVPVRNLGRGFGRGGWSL